MLVLRHRLAHVLVAAVAAVCLVAVNGCAPSSSSSRPGGGAPSTTAPPVSGIHRATSGGAAREGRFSDPYRIGPPTSSSSAPLSFSGTFDETITCDDSLKPGCFTPSTLSVEPDSALKADIDGHGLVLRSTKAHHPTRAADGSWQMVLAAVVAPKGTSGRGSKGGWNVILHASPTVGPDGASAPTHWSADSLLVGSLDHGTPATYDGKYVSDGGRLYLIYEKELSSHPSVFGLVAQQLDSYSQPAATAPVTLLAPSTAGGGLASENYFDLGQKDGFRLVEVGNIIEVNGKYLMLYSVGSYKRPVYKIGVAWSDTFLPSHGETYRKVTMPDPKGVWGSKGGQEVDYLLQSQLPDWPNYAGNSVCAPGVGSLVQRDGKWYLFFAGYDPTEKLTGSDHTFNASHRQPYYVPVHLDIPDNTTVAGASDRQIRSWIMPELAGQ